MYLFNNVTANFMNFQSNPEEKDLASHTGFIESISLTTFSKKQDSPVEGHALLVTLNNERGFSMFFSDEVLATECYNYVLSVLYTATNGYAFIDFNSFNERNERYQKIKLKSVN